MEIFKEFVKLASAFAWPCTVLLILFICRAQVKQLIVALLERIKAGSPVETPWFSVGEAPVSMESPGDEEAVTVEHLALTHSSWRYPKKDKDFGMPMYVFHAIIQAQDKTLDRIEYVKYFLHSSYPNSEQTSTDRESKFKLKELAWGESLLRAEVKIKGQDQKLTLSRYINLNVTGPRM